MSNDTVSATRDKVRRILTDKLGSVRLTNDDKFIVQHNSAVLFVSVEEGFNGGSVVNIGCPLITEVEITNDLCRWVATQGQHFRLGGCGIIVNEGSSKGMVHFTYSLTGDDLDESELFNAVMAVIMCSDQLDNELRDRFGGSLFGPE